MNRAARFAAIALLAACSGLGDDNGDTSDAASTVYACGSDECDTADGEFCILESSAEGALRATHCVVGDCDDCSCAQRETVDYFDGGLNCIGIVLCSQEGDQYTVECTNQTG